MDRFLIFKRRTELGLTQQDVANACGVSKVTVSMWESGEIENMRQDRLMRLASYLQLSPFEIMGFSTGKDLAIDDTERSLIMAYRAQPSSVQDAIKRMLGIGS